MKNYWVLFILILSQLQIWSQEVNCQMVFFRGNPEGSRGELFKMNLADRSVQKLGRSGSRPDYFPNISPNGDWIAFQSYRSAGWRIWIMDKEGGQARRLIKNGTGINSYEFDPSFDHTGNNVLFFRHSKNGSDLFKVSLKKGIVTPVTSSPGIAEFSPNVSITGEIVFTYIEGKKKGIAKIGVNGDRTILTQDQNWNDHAPIWFPDGSQILFYSDRGGSLELYTMSRDGSKVTRLIKDDMLKNSGIKPGKYLPLNEGWNICLQYRASFTPDGRWIGFSADTKDSREIFLVSTDGRIIKQLTKNSVHEGFPTFF